MRIIVLTSILISLFWASPSKAQVLSDQMLSLHCKRGEHKTHDGSKTAQSSDPTVFIFNINYRVDEKSSDVLIVPLDQSLPFKQTQAIKGGPLLVMAAFEETPRQLISSSANMKNTDGVGYMMFIDIVKHMTNPTVSLWLGKDQIRFACFFEPGLFATPTL